MTIFALFALAALAAIVLIGGLLRHIWSKHEQRTIKKNWQERERLLGVCPSNGFEGSATRNAIAHLAQDRRSRWSQWFAIPRKLAPGYYWDRLLDSRRPVAPSHEIFEWRPRSAGTRDVPQAETVARVLYIVARDQPELFAFLRQDFAAEEAEGTIEILMNRRQGGQPREADGRDPRRNWGVSVDLREMGFVLVRQQAPFLRVPSVD